MKSILLIALALPFTVAHAEVYRCPQTYPDKAALAVPLTGAYMMWGERPSDGPPFPSGWETPREEVAADGLDLHYALPEDEQSWLICQYGARKRIKGRFYKGREWGQYMGGGEKYPWFLKLGPKISECTVQTREIKARSPGKSTWTVTATCQQSVPG